MCCPTPHRPDAIQDAAFEESNPGYVVKRVDVSGFLVVLPCLNSFTPCGLIRSPCGLLCLIRSQWHVQVLVNDAEWWKRHADCE